MPNTRHPTPHFTTAVTPVAQSTFAGELAARWSSRRLLRSLLALPLVLFIPPAAAHAETCQEKYSAQPPRVGASANLPDCRAYELVTPPDLGRTQDLTFTRGNDRAVPSSDGESIGLESVVPLEPSPGTPASITGTHAVFSRTSAGWVMRSVVESGDSEDSITIYGQGLLSPDLSQVAFSSRTAQLNAVEVSPDLAFEVGPVGGPYAVVADVPEEDEAEFLGANAGTASVPAFSDVLFVSVDHALASSGAERAVGEGTVGGAKDLYDWVGGRLVLVNVTSGGTLLDKCGAELGEGFTSTGVGATGAVSEDGSKVFFTSPQPEASSKFGSVCPPSS